jgi:MFS family permease
MTAPATRAERLLVPSAFITNLGNSVQLTAASVLVLTTERTVLSVGWLFIAVAVPQVLLSLYFGRLADRFDRRTLCVIADLFSALAALALPVWLLLGGPANIAAYVASFALAAVAALFMPANNALVKERVRTERLGQFSANFEIAVQAGTLLSAAAGGFMIQLFGVKPLFFFNAVTFIGSALLLWAMGPRPRTAPDTTPDGAETVEAAAPGQAEEPAPRPAAASATKPPILRLGLLYALGNVVIVVSNAILVALVLQQFHRGAGILGLVDALAGIGIMLAAATYKRVSTKTSNLRIALVGYLGVAAVIALEPLHVVLLMVLIPLAGLTFGLARVASRTMLMTAVDESRAGRVFGATNAFGLGFSTTATVVLAVIADHTRISVAFYGVALLVAGIALATITSLARPATAGAGASAPAEPALETTS